jgi:hypothetical protein
MSNGSERDLDSKALNILCEGMACELRAVVRDQLGGYSKMAHQSLYEIYSCLCGYLSNWLYFRPLFNLVDCNEQEFKAPGTSGERAQDIKPPDQKRLGERYRLESLSWLMNVLGVEVAGFTSGDKLCCVLESRVPVETLPESFADQGSRSKVRAARALMYLCQ